MIEGTVLWLLAGGSLLIAIGAVLMLAHTRDDARLTARLRGVRFDAVEPVKAEPRMPLVPRFVNFVGKLLARSRLVQSTMGAGMRDTLFQAGFRGERAFATFLGSKVLLLVALPVIAYLLIPSDVSPMKRNVAVVAAAALGMLGPEFFIKYRRGQYLKALENGLSDALDLMVICVEAGLGLEPAMERVGHEIVAAHPQVALELELTTNEMRVVADRRAAILNLGLRTGLEPLKRLSTTLVQTLQYGTPLGAALRVLSAELRAETMTRFEARAARLPVMLTVPMIMFILPCIFLVVGGPALVQVLAIMHR